MKIYVKNKTKQAKPLWGHGPMKNTLSLCCWESPIVVSAAFGRAGAMSEVQGSPEYHKQAFVVLCVIKQLTTGWRLEMQPKKQKQASNSLVKHYAR